MLATTSHHLQRSTRGFAARGGVAAWIGNHFWPRTTMAIIIAISAGFGLAGSIGLRFCGVSAMAVRYPLAVMVAYTAFVVLISRLATVLAGHLGRHPDFARREAARRQIRNPDDPEPELTEYLDRRQRDPDVDDSEETLAAIIFWLGSTVVLICAYFIAIAPTLLAELIVEGGLAEWLYRPRSGGDGHRLLPVAVERTALAAVGMALCTLGLGLVLQYQVPKAETVDEVLQELRNPTPVTSEPKIFDRR